jgi:pyridoxamine 5'-phosphate oxidase
VDKPIADLRRDYRLASLDETTVGDDPLAFFRRWFGEAHAAGIDEVNAMTLATASPGGQPHARVVLLKGLDDQGFVFYTNYDSDKGVQLAANPQAAAVFFWKELERQVRIEGIVERVSESESNAYFASRPEGSRIGAWASAQSQPVDSRGVLEAIFQSYEEKFSGDDIPRPAHWGGYCIIPHRVEFWQGRSSRMHDRIVFIRGNDGGWSRQRLQP